MNLENILDELISNEIEFNNTINMVPSENYASVISRLPFLLDVYNRYFFNSKRESDAWNFRGAQDVCNIETDIAIPILKELGRSKYVNLRPISGLNGMLVILRALGNGRGSNILTVSPEQGGHYATKDIAESLGLNVDFIKGFDEHNIDFKKLGEQVKIKKYDLVYIDQSNCLFPIDIKKLVPKIKENSPHTLIHVDASHWLGLILGGAMDNPLLCGADSFGGSTHKTFPGPQKAVFLTDNPILNEKVRQAQFYLISSHHFGSVVSLAIALVEFKERGGFKYANQVVKNAVVLAETLDELGYDVKGKKYGFSSGNQVWMSTNNKGIDSYEASERLYKCGIKVNVFDELPGHKGFILRIGVNEITRMGCKEDNIRELALIMDEAINEACNISILKTRIKSLRKKCNCDYGFSIKEEGIREKIAELVNSLIIP